jgi:DNA-binding NarL/FixJ family response regulator
MDIAMEPVNGLDASANIKKEYPDARIILVTNYDEPAFRKRAEELGISDYILKENLVHLSELLMGKS